MSDPHEHPGREPLWQRLRGGVLAVLKWSPDIPARILKRGWAVLVPVNVALAILVYLGFTHEGWRAFAREAVVYVTSFWIMLTLQASRRRRSRRTSEMAEFGETDWFNPSRKP